jgi:hypothetical protein
MCKSTFECSAEVSDNIDTPKHTEAHRGKPKYADRSSDSVTYSIDTICLIIRGEDPWDDSGVQLLFFRLTMLGIDRLHGFESYDSGSDDSERKFKGGTREAEGPAGESERGRPADEFGRR